jgi:FMN phosphatase YigB (HAD superfamily)
VQDVGYEHEDRYRDMRLDRHLEYDIDSFKVIRNTFSPFLKPNQEVPAPLIAELYQKYSTGEPYHLYPDVKKFFLEVQKYRRSSSSAELQWPYEKIVVGIITNSDDRVPSILESFDLQIAPRRFGGSAQNDKDSWIPKDIEFVVQSYDVGYEKPDPRIFDAATSMLENFLAEDEQGLSAEDFEQLYVGDELENDFDGATGAGWHAVLLDRNGVMDKAKNFRIGKVGLKDKEGKERKIIMARSLLDLGIWRPRTDS